MENLSTLLESQELNDVFEEILPTLRRIIEEHITPECGDKKEYLQINDAFQIAMPSSLKNKKLPLPKYFNDSSFCSEIFYIKYSRPRNQSF